MVRHAPHATIVRAVRTNVFPGDFAGKAFWREQRNVLSVVGFIRLPPTRVVEIGTGVEM